MILVFGASGFIGSHVSALLRRCGERVVGTYATRPRAGLVHFDLQDPRLERPGLPLGDATHAVICASCVTDMDQCARDNATVYRIDVEGVCSLLAQLLQRGIVPVFLSSDHVFDGTRGNYVEDDVPKPAMVYGKHKLLVERFLRDQPRPYVIARLGKVFGRDPNDGTLLTRWIEQLERGEHLRCATDQRFSPSCVTDIARALHRIVSRRLTGLYHVASPESFSRYELARLVQRTLDIRTGHVEPCSIRDFPFLEARPLDISLDSRAFRAAAGFRFIPMQTHLRALRQGRREPANVAAPSVEPTAGAMS